MKKYTQIFVCICLLVLLAIGLICLRPEEARIDIISPGKGDMRSVSGDKQTDTCMLLSDGSTDAILNDQEVRAWNEMVDQYSVGKVSTIERRQPAGYPMHNFSLLVKVGEKPLRYEIIRTEVNRIIGEEAATSRERFAAVRLLYGRDLPATESSRLLEYLRDSNRYIGMNETQSYVFINNLLKIFHDKKILDDDYLEISIAVIHNDEEREVIRDYTLQGISRAHVHADEAQRLVILDTLWSILESEKQTSLAATSLLAINRIARSNELPEGSLPRLLDKINELVSAENVDPRSRAASIQVAAQLNRHDLVPALLTVIESENEQSPVRIAALASLKELDYDGIQALYQQEAQSGDTASAHVAKAALQTF